MACPPLPCGRRRLPITALGVLGIAAWWVSASMCFALGHPRHASAGCGASRADGRAQARPRGLLVLGAGAGASSSAQGAPPAEASKEKGKSQEEIDDAVLRMAMAMAEEEETSAGAAAPDAAGKEKEEEGFEFDFQLVITAVLVSLIVYSFGSAFIGISSGRIQDRTGGDFTAYDFADNIVSFKEWNLEYSLGFDPFKLFNKS
mmetsp:Transcript_49627/g.153220  ORF Transcript_49627/g.153220 Transcript_49627/m.153220 type:complete len:203 (+) Transcript_49627:61-669(+)